MLNPTYEKAVADVRTKSGFYLSASFGGAGDQLFYELLFHYSYVQFPGSRSIKFTEKNSLPGA
jgi:hypothetical protein